MHEGFPKNMINANFLKLIFPNPVKKQKKSSGKRGIIIVNNKNHVYDLVSDALLAHLIYFSLLKIELTKSSPYFLAAINAPNEPRQIPI